MSTTPRHPASVGAGSQSADSLVERVRARVLAADTALQQRATAAAAAAAAAASKPETGEPAKPATSLPGDRELRALKLVYRTMGRTHRRYRQRTGYRVPSALRDAARDFRREPSVFSLVPVAGFLDDLGLLRW